jgi:guanylate kinase
MKKIFVLVGKSASGKDTIFRKVVEQIPQLHPIVYSTTRPQRANEINGREYFFVDEKVIEAAELSGTLIEKRVYETIKGPWTYATILDKQFVKNEYGIIVLPPKGLNSFVEFFGEEIIVPIFIHVDDGVRLRRSLDRDELNKNPNYAETCRRFLADEKDFAGLEFEHEFENADLEKCVQEVCKFIKQEVKNI